jgi:hypothetical protein
MSAAALIVAKEDWQTTFYRKMCVELFFNHPNLNPIVGNFRRT